MAATPEVFSDAVRHGLYRAIRERRDVRSPFLPDPVPPDAQRAGDVPDIVSVRVAPLVLVSDDNYSQSHITQFLASEMISFR